MPYRYPPVQRVDGGENHYDLMVDSQAGTPANASIIYVPKGRQWNALFFYPIAGTNIFVDFTTDEVARITAPTPTARFLNLTTVSQLSYTTIGSGIYGFAGVTALRLWSSGGTDNNLLVAVGLTRGGI